MAALADSGPTEQCKNEFSVLEAIYGNELVFEGQYRLKVCTDMIAIIAILR